MGKYLEAGKAKILNEIADSKQIKEELKSELKQELNSNDASKKQVGF